MRENTFNSSSKPMRIKIVIPINDSVYNDIVLNAAQDAASPNTILAIENISQGNNCIESIEDSNRNAPHTADLIRQAETDGFDGVFVCDMDMCGIDRAREIYGVKIPLHGGFSSNMPIAAKRGNFIVMTILDSVIDMQQHWADRYAQGQCIAIHPIGLGVHELHDSQLAFLALCNKIDNVLKTDTTNTKKSIVFGCSGFVNMAKPLMEFLRQKGYKDIVVVDPNRTAINVLEQEILALRQVEMVSVDEMK